MLSNLQQIRLIRVLNAIMGNIVSCMLSIIYHSSLDLTQSPLSCLLRQMQLSSQHPGPQAVNTKRGSGLFDDDPLGGVTMSPLASPRIAPPTLPPGPSNQSSSATITTVAGCSVSAPVCIPNSGGGSRVDTEAFDYPCSCGCCRRGRVGGTEGKVGGHDSAFNSGGTPTAICEFGAVGSNSLHSMASEGQDSAMALSEAKEEAATPDLPSSLLLDTSGGFGPMVRIYGKRTNLALLNLAEGAYKLFEQSTWVNGRFCLFLQQYSFSRTIPGDSANLNCPSHCGSFIWSSLCL